jgi:hypothetical protein
MWAELRTITAQGPPGSENAPKGLHDHKVLGRSFDVVHILIQEQDSKDLEPSPQEWKIISTTFLALQGGCLGGILHCATVPELPGM